MQSSSVRPLRSRRALIKTARFCAVIAMAGLVSALVSRVGQTRAQQEPTQPVAQKPKPSADELERWRQTIVHTKRPKKACFTAEYPATTWTEVPCGKPPKGPFLPAGGPRSLKVGNGTDFAAQAASGYISRAEGSFDSVTSLKSACSVQCPNLKCPTNPTCTSSDVKNDFSLQINSNTFSTSACKGHANCAGWEQFFFTNRACAESPFPACAFIQYWLLGYGDSCPQGWHSYQHSCAINSQNSVNFLPFLVDDLGFMKLTGEVAGVDAEDDVVTFTYATKSYSAPGDNRLRELGQKWQISEFNIFGDMDGSQAVLNTGTTLVVRNLVDSGTTSAPLCVAPGGATGETNSLTLAELQTRPTNAGVKRTDIVNTQPNTANGGIWSGGPGPALVFMESNVAGTVSAVTGPAGSIAKGCEHTVTVGGTEAGGSEPKPVEGGVCKAGEKCCEKTRDGCLRCIPSNLSCP
jgi:hypothetical protein